MLRATCGCTFVTLRYITPFNQGAGTPNRSQQEARLCCTLHIIAASCKCLLIIDRLHQQGRQQATGCTRQHTSWTRGAYRAHTGRPGGPVAPVTTAHRAATADTAANVHVLALTFVAGSNHTCVHGMRGVWGACKWTLDRPRATVPIHKKTWI